MKNDANMYPPAYIKDKKARTKKTVIGCLFVCLIFIGLFYYMFNAWRHAMNRSLYTACMEQMSHVKAGMEEYMEKNNNSLAGTNVPDDMCQYILPGYDNASECRGKIMERIYADGICQKNSFSYKTNTGYDFELRVASWDISHCKICITEYKTMPEKYNDCGGPFRCVHKKKEIR